MLRSNLKYFLIGVVVLGMGLIPAGAQVNVPVSGYEIFLGRNCLLMGQAGTCGATFTGWTGGGSSWVGFPGTRQGVWSIQINYTGHPSLPGSVNVVSGKWSFLFANGLELQGRVVSGSVTWPQQGESGCGGVINAAYAQATLSVKGGGTATVNGCLHDIPAGTVIPPTVWGAFTF